MSNGADRVDLDTYAEGLHEAIHAYLDSGDLTELQAIAERWRAEGLAASKAGNVGKATFFRVAVRTLQPLLNNPDSLLPENNSF